MNRSLKDADLIKSKALPAAEATAYTDAIDLGAEALGPDGDRFEAELAIPETPALVAGSITGKLQDSADGVNFADIAALGSLTVAGVAVTGAEAASQVFRLPRTTRRYLRGSFAVAAGGGDNTGVSAELRLLF